MSNDVLERWLEAVLSAPGATALTDPESARRMLLDDALRAADIVAENRGPVVAAPRTEGVQRLRPDSVGLVGVLAGVVASFATQGRARAEGRESGRPAGPRHAAPHPPGAQARRRPGQEPGQ